MATEPFRSSTNITLSHFSKLCMVSFQNIRSVRGPNVTEILICLVIFYVYVLWLTYLCIYTSHKLVFPHKMSNCNFHLQKGQPHCNTMSWSDTKWHPVTKSMFGLLFRGESVRVEFFGFWPDLRIMMYGIDKSYNSGTFRYVDLAYFQILNAYPVSPAKYKRVNLIKL